MAEEQKQVGKFDFLKKIFGKKSDNTVTSNAEESLPKNISPEKIGKSSEIKNGYTKNSAYLQILVENTMTFQQMAEDINISRQNVQKLVELMGGEKRTGADGKFITEQQKRVLAETQKNKILSLRKRPETKSTDTRIEPVDTKKEKTLLGMFGGYDKTKVNKRGKPRRPGALQRARRMRSSRRKRTIGKLAKVALSLTGVGKIGRLAKFGLLKTVGAGKYRSFAKMSKGFIKISEKLAGTISKSIVGLLNTFGSAFTVKNIIGAFTKYFSIAAIFGVLFVAFKDTIMGFVKNILGKISDFIEMLKKAFVDLFKSALTKVKEFFKPFIKKVKDFIDAFKNRLKEIIQKGIALPFGVGSNIEKFVKASGLDKFVGLYDKEKPEEEPTKEELEEEPKEVVKEEPKEDVITKPEEIITKPEPTPPTEPSDIFERIRQTQVPKKEEVTPTPEPVPTPEVLKVEPTPAPTPEVVKVPSKPAQKQKETESLAERMISEAKKIKRIISGRKPFSPAPNYKKIIEVGRGYIIAETTDGKIVKVKGTRGWRNNNPGNMINPPKGFGKYVIGRDVYGDPIFDTYEHGLEARRALLFVPGSTKQNYSEMSLAEAMPIYTPATVEKATGQRGDPKKYLRLMLERITGVTPDTKLKEMTLTQQNQMLETISLNEGIRGNESEIEVLDNSKSEVSKVVPTPAPIVKPETPKVTPQQSKKVSEAPIENQPVSIGSKISSASTEIAAERRIQQKPKVPVIVNAETVNNNIVQQNIVQNTVQPSNAASDLLSRASR